MNLIKKVFWSLALVLSVVAVSLAAYSAQNSAPDQGPASKNLHH